MKGQLGSPASVMPVTGIWSPSARGQAIAALGLAATPRILEILTKTREYANDNERDALFVALALLRDARATLPLVAFLADGYPEPVKEQAASALGRIADSRGVDVLSVTLRNPAAPVQLRGACALAIGQIRDPRGLEPLLEVFSNENTSNVLKQQALLGIGSMGDIRASAPLTARLDQEQNTQNVKQILSALESVGDTKSLRVVASVANQDPDESVRERATEAYHAIAERLHIPH